MTDQASAVLTTAASVTYSLAVAQSMPSIAKTS